MNKILLLLFSLIFCFGIANGQVTEPIKDSDEMYVRTLKSQGPSNHLRLENGTLIKVHDRFSVKNRINWQGFNGIIELVNLRTGRTYGYCSKSIPSKMNKKLSFIEFFTRINYTFTKGSDERKNMKLVLGKTWYMVGDTLRIPSTLPLGNNMVYVASPISIENSTKMVLPYDKETNEIVITYDFLLRKNIKLEESDKLLLNIEYGENGASFEHVTSDMIIEYIKQ